MYLVSVWMVGRVRLVRNKVYFVFTWMVGWITLYPDVPDRGMDGRTGRTT